MFRRQHLDAPGPWPERIGFDCPCKDRLFLMDFFEVSTVGAYFPVVPQDSQGVPWDCFNDEIGARPARDWRPAQRWRRYGWDWRPATHGDWRPACPRDWRPARLRDWRPARTGLAPGPLWGLAPGLCTLCLCSLFRKLP